MSIETGSEYISKLNELLGQLDFDESTRSNILDVWSAWENQNIERPVSLDYTIENPNHMLLSYWEDILEMIGRSENKSLPYFGFAQLKDLNAYAKTTSNGDQVVILDQYLELLLNTFFIVSAFLCYKHADKDIDLYYNHIIDSIRSALISTTAWHRPELRNEFLCIIKRDYEISEMGMFIGRSVLFFILCHEIAHHRLGHTTNPTHLPIYVDSIQVGSLDYDQPDFNDEFAADHQGCLFFLGLIDNFGKLKSAVVNKQLDRAPLIFFDFLDIYYLVKNSIYGNSSVESKTHPSPLIRKQALIDNFSSHFSEEGAEIYEGMHETIAYIKDRFIEEQQCKRLM